MAKTALLIIDVQESFRHRPYFRVDDLPVFFDRLQQLIDGAGRKGWAIAQVFHVEPEGAFSEASGLVRPLAELTCRPDIVIKKQVHSALGSSLLPGWLTGQGISHLVISGIRTEQCCETTTRHASDSGYSVDFVTEATLTFPMQHPNGNTYSPAMIKERTELVLHERFAQVRTVRQVLGE